MKKSTAIILCALGFFALWCSLPDSNENQDIIVQKYSESVSVTNSLPPATVPAVQSAPYHFILNTSTNCVHSENSCTAAQQILDKNYAEIDIGSDRLADYEGVYWACGKCCSYELREILPKP